MSDVQLLILDEIGIRLTNILKVNGYRFDLKPKAIKRASLKPFQSGDLPAVNYWPVADDKTGKQGGMELKELGVTIEVYDVTRDEPFTDLGIKIGNDVATALFRSTSFPKVTDTVSPALGGLVSELSVNSLVPIISEGSSPWCGALLDVTVKYNINLGDFSAVTNF
jgi:hypothetical protein